MPGTKPAVDSWHRSPFVPSQSFRISLRRIAGRFAMAFDSLMRIGQHRFRKANIANRGDKPTIDPVGLLAQPNDVADPCKQLRQPTRLVKLSPGCAFFQMALTIMKILTGHRASFLSTAFRLMRAESTSTYAFQSQQDTPSRKMFASAVGHSAPLMCGSPSERISKREDSFSTPTNRVEYRSCVTL